MNYFSLFQGILNPKQLEGLRLLVTPFPQQQFDQTEHRRSALPSRGVTCFDCHVNGHPNGATHLVGDIRPQGCRHRLDTPPLRGVNVLERGSQVHFMAEFQALLDFPPAPYYTDNLMHNLRTERFFTPRMINGRFAAADGPIKTFPLRGIKESPPYVHDGRLLTLEDTVEFFNIIQQLKLTAQEKQDLVEFLRTL